MEAAKTQRVLLGRLVRRTTIGVTAIDEEEGWHVLLDEQAKGKQTTADASRQDPDKRPFDDINVVPSRVKEFEYFTTKFRRMMLVVEALFGVSRWLD